MILEKTVSVLISTMDDIVPLYVEKNRGHAIIINQTKNLNFSLESDETEVYNFHEKGLSKSRNRAFSLCRADFCCIADNDIFYVEDYNDKVKKYFDVISNADVLVFQIFTPEGVPYKKYKNLIFKMNKFDILRVSSIEIVVRRESVLKNKINFDEKFGLGGQFKCGEENIFLSDCIKNGLNIYAINCPLVFHPIESSGKNIDDKFFFDRGAVFCRIYGILLASFLFIYFSYKKSLVKKEFMKNLTLMFKGMFEYLRSK